MSPSVFAAVVGPVTGSTAPARGGKADARSVGDGTFASALNEVPANDVSPKPTPVRADKSSDAVSAESEPAATDAPAAEAAETAAPDAIQAETVPVAGVPPGVPAIPVTDVVPSAQVPVVASDAVEADGSADVAAPPPAVPEGQGDADAAAGSPAGQSEAPDPAASIPAKDSSPASKADLAARAEQAASAKADASQGQPQPVQADEPVVPAEPKVVVPPASDRARDVAAVNSAVLTPVRPAKAAAVPAAEPTTVPFEGSDAASSEGDAPPPVATAPAPVEPARVRDVIDRAVARTTADASSPEVEASSSGATKSAGAAASPPPAVTLKASSPVEVAPVPVAAAAAEEPAATPSGASTQPAPEATEAAQAPVLSTLSRASIETTAQIAAQITRKLEGRSTRFEMALTPEGLGRVDISLDIEADGALRATLAFDNPVAATELRGRVDELRRQLTEAGFTLADDALSFADRDPSAGRGGAFDRPSDRQHNARAFGAASRLSAEADVSAQPPRWVHLSLTPTGVDMKV